MTSFKNCAETFIIDLCLVHFDFLALGFKNDRTFFWLTNWMC